MTLFIPKIILLRIIDLFVIISSNSLFFNVHHLKIFHLFDARGFTHVRGDDNVKMMPKFEIVGDLG